MSENSAGAASNPDCAHCGNATEPWITSCLGCGAPVGTTPSAPLADRVAPNLEPDRTVRASQTWLDIPITSDEPVKVALFSQYLTEQGIPFEHSRRFVSIPASEIDRMVQNIGVWAFKPESDDDHRSVDSLGKTLREIGNTVLASVYEPATSAAIHSSGIDLREAL